MEAQMDQTHIPKPHVTRRPSIREIAGKHRRDCVEALAQIVNDAKADAAARVQAAEKLLDLAAKKAAA